MITDEAFRQAVKAAIAEHKKDRNIAFIWEGQTYWIISAGFPMEETSLPNLQ